MKKMFLMALSAVVLCACQNTQMTSEQAAVAKALYADVAYPAQAGSISTLVLSQETTPLAGCPRDFASAYKDYISSWKKFIPIEKQMYEQNYEKARADISEFLKSYLKDPTGAVVKLKNEWPKYSKDIDKAFAAVRESFVEFTNVAANYGIAIPKDSIFKF